MVQTNVKSVASSNVSSVSDFSSNARSLKKEFDVEDDVNSSNKLDEDFEASDFDFWLITTPLNFSSSHLRDIPLVSNMSTATFPVKISTGKTDEQTKKWYICDTSAAGDGTVIPQAVIVPSEENHMFKCKNITSHVRVKEKIVLQKANIEHCIPRPPPPSISSGLFERLQLVGAHPLNKSVKHAQQAEISSEETSCPDWSSKKRKKEKKSHKKKKKLKAE